MARSGVAAVRLLLSKGAIVRAVDEKPMEEVQGITVEPQTEAAFRDADLVVLSPGVPADLDVLTTVRSRGIPVIGELELAAPLLRAAISASPEPTAKPPLPRSPVTFCASPESPARWEATSEHLPLQWLRRRVRINGMSSSYPAFNSRPSKPFTLPSQRASMSRRIIWTVITPSKTTRTRRHGYSKRNVKTIGRSSTRTIR